MRLSDFQMASEQRDEARLEAMLRRVNDTATSYPRMKTIPRVFAERVAEAPDALAVWQDDLRLSYCALDSKSSHCARILCSTGLGRDDLVGVMLDRSPTCIVAMLGALKSGAAYLPIDPDLPIDRIATILRDSRARVLLTERRYADQCQLLREACSDLRSTYFADSLPSDPPSAADGGFDRSEPGSLAYVMYTSGTTGVPKGVMIDHRSVLRLVLNTNYIRLGPSDRILQTGSLSFDASTFEIWGALLNGGALCLPRKDSLLDPAELKALIRTHEITTMWITAGLFNALSSEDVMVFAGLKTLLCGGERLSPHHVNLVRRNHPGLALINGYGPTENTTFTTTFEIRQESTGDVPIGGPIANTTVHILNPALEPVSIGVPGELYTGGDGLARGYLNDPELTKAKFINDPLRPGERLYRTGDLASWRDDGSIDYLGRADEQVKIRGYRIELGEIETLLLQDECLKQAVVTVRAEADGGRALVAYYTARQVINSDLLRNRLRRCLPDYMVPARFVQMEQFPLTSNGKIDKAALPAPERVISGRSDSAKRERTRTETELVHIWEQVLCRSGIDIDSNFFDLGGHSLRAVKLIYLIREKFGVLLPFTILFEAPTLEALADRIVDAVEFGHASIDQPLVALGPQSGQRALFAFPPGTGDALGYSELANRLPICRFYAFNFVESEASAAGYAQRVIDSGSDEPYILFGYSGGGNLAFRTAVELERRGKCVSDIVMLDSSRFLAPFDFPAGEARRLALEFVGTDSVQPYLQNPALKDKVVRTIERYYDMLAKTPDEAITAANIHVILSENSQDSFYQDGQMVCSKSRWVEVTTGAYQQYSGHGDHAHMLHRPPLQPNAELLHRIVSGTRIECGDR